MKPLNGLLPTAQAGEPWWANENDERAWEPTRSNEKRRAAVRAIVLYPTNALVQDQVTRLRRAIATVPPAALGGNRLYVGQYTRFNVGQGPTACRQLPE